MITNKKTDSNPCRIEIRRTITRTVNAFATKTVYFMRGLPSCGKSTTAKKLAGKNGVVIETDSFFQAGDGPEHYQYESERIDEARSWAKERLRKALEENRSPIVVDRGNGLNRESREFVEMAIDHGYGVEIREPESPWWQEIKVLLKYRPVTDPILDQWAKQLESMSESTHRVGYRTIRHRMESWADDISIDDILHY